MSAARDDDSPGAPPRLGELWVTDPTTNSLRLSWTVPEGHFDSFVVQFKDKSGPQVVPVKGQERTATITALDAGRKYRFLLYGLLGKKRFGPLTAEGTTGEVFPAGRSAEGHCCGHDLSFPCPALRGHRHDQLSYVLPVSVSEPMNAVEHTGEKHPTKPRLGEELQVTSVTQNSVDLSWTVPEGQFDSFVIQYKDRDGQSQVVPVDGGHREVRVSGLDPGRRYKLLLYGLRDSKRVGPLSVIAVTGECDRTPNRSTSFGGGFTGHNLHIVPNGLCHMYKSQNSHSGRHKEIPSPLYPRSVKGLATSVGQRNRQVRKKRFSH